MQQMLGIVGTVIFIGGDGFAAAVGKCRLFCGVAVREKLVASLAIVSIGYGTITACQCAFFAFWNLRAVTSRQWLRGNSLVSSRAVPPRF